MARFSIRTRLTGLFLAAVSVVYLIGALVLVTLVDRTTQTHDQNLVQAAMARAQAELLSPRLRTHADLDEVNLPASGDAVVQVTNIAGTKVWAATKLLDGDPVIAHARASFSAPSGLTLVYDRQHNRDILNQLSDGQVQTITTFRGGGLIFGFLYASSSRHGEALLTLVVVSSYPFLLLVVGLLVWFGVGFALVPVEEMRQRVSDIAAADLSRRVPDAGGADEVARLARTLNAMLERLESASRFQQEFVSNASHELRSPLATLLATAERADSDLDPARRAAALAVVLREGRRLEAIIDDLFWLARHDEGGVPTTRVDVDLDDILFEEAARVRSLSELTVSMAEVRAVRVGGDAAMLRRMIRNVVDNAARYAASELRFACAREGAYAVVRVANDGEPVDVATSARLFERFVRDDPARTRQGVSTGLGLSIVAEIASRHGGSAAFVEVAHGTMVELRVRVEP